MRNQTSPTRRWIGLAALVLSLAAAAQAQTYTFSTLYSFKNNGTDPEFSTAPVIVDSSGNLYGTAGAGRFGLGAVFKVTPAGKLSVLHSFKGAPADGDTPFTGLTRDTAGNLYGTTNAGGSHSLGTVFKLTPSGHETILHSFNSTDGNSPNGVTLDSAGNIYGTTAFGGGNSEGVAFEINTGGQFTLLHTFCSLSGCADGDEPIGNLVVDSAGNIYGTTGNIIGFGTVYKLTKTGVQTILHTFNFNDGDDPNALILDSKGILHGAAYDGGTHSQGTLFTLPKGGGTLTTLYNFCGKSRCTDGKLIPGPIAIDKSGNTFGVGFESAGNTGSVVWEFSAAGKESVLYTFPNSTSMAGLAIDSAGNLYGTTYDGGTNGVGSVFKLTLAK